MATMTRKYEPLNQEKHERLRLGDTESYRFAAETTLVPIILDEIAVVAREYPVIFPDNESGLPCALTGMRPETNAYVDDRGHWRADYIPLQIRQHPFALTEVAGDVGEDGKKRFTLCIDPDAAEFTDLEGELVFDSNGRLGEKASAKGEMAKQLQERSGITRALVRLLDEAGLLVERQIKMKLFNDETRQVQGFRVVDEKVLNAMSDEDFVALRNKGALPLVYAQLMSMANFRQGVLAGQVKPKAPAQEKKKKDEGGIDLDMFIDDSGDFEIFH